MHKKTLYALPFLLAALSLVACGAPDVDIEYVSEYENDGRYDKRIEIDGPSGDYAEVFALTETELLELIEEKLASGPGGRDFETSDDFDIDDKGTEMEHEVDAESSKGKLDYWMDIDSSGEVQYDLEAELSSGTMQQVLTEARRRRLANQNPSVTIVNVANPSDFARQQATQRREMQSKDLSDTAVFVNIDPRLSELCALEANTSFFRYDEAELTPQAKQKLSDVAACLTSGPARGQSIVLVGYADPRGSDTYNLNLSQSRASTVRAFLEDQGVALNRMTTSTMGERQAHDEQPSYWPYDRRVEIRLAD